MIILLPTVYLPRPTHAADAASAKDLEVRADGHVDEPAAGQAHARRPRERLERSVGGPA